VSSLGLASPAQSCRSTGIAQEIAHCCSAEIREPEDARSRGLRLPVRTSRNSHELPVRRLDGSRIAPIEQHLEGATGPAAALTLAATGLVAKRASARARLMA